MRNSQKNGESEVAHTKKVDVATGSVFSYFRRLTFVKSIDRPVGWPASGRRPKVHIAPVPLMAGWRDVRRMCGMANGTK